MTIYIVFSLKLGQSLEYQSYSRCDIRRMGIARFGSLVLVLFFVLVLFLFLFLVLVLNLISACEASILCNKTGIHMIYYTLIQISLSIL